MGSFGMGGGEILMITPAMLYTPEYYDTYYDSFKCYHNNSQSPLTLHPSNAETDRDAPCFLAGQAFFFFF